MGLSVLKSYKEANVFAKLALLFLSIAMYVGWYGYCTASWGRTFPTADSDYFFGYGIWRVADNQFRNSDPTATSGSHAPVPQVFHTDGWLLAWYAAFQAFTTLGFICLNAGYVLVILLVYVGPCKANADLAFWNAINSFFGSICWLVAVVLFAVQFDATYDTFNYDDPALGYSFALGVISAVLQLAAGVMLLLIKPRDAAPAAAETS